MSEGRIEKRFAACAARNRPAFVSFVMAGDPDQATSQAILDGLPAAGADLIELGMPFSDPMADGPAVQLAGRRALASGQTLSRTLEMVQSFRRHDNETPIVLMGYYNPIYVADPGKFVVAAKEAGVDGLIIVDLPAEEDSELCLPAISAGLNFIRLTTPTTDEARLARVLKNSSGFVYYVSMTGITGAVIKNRAAIGEAVRRIKARTDLPVAVGFGIKTPDDARVIGREADGVVVGTALVSVVADSLVDGRAGPDTVAAVHRLVRTLAEGVKQAKS